MYKVTLSMPIYNVAPYVERALLSALNQTFESIEFLLVDDRGTDNSMDIVHRVIKEHPRGKDVRIIEHPHNIGLGATRNTAIDNAQGEYLFFMDSDDEITPDCIQVLYDKMMEEKVDMVVGSLTEITVEGEKVVYKLKDQTWRGELCLSKYYYSEKQYFPVMTWNKLYDLSFLRKNEIRCYPNHLNEDMVFSLLLKYYIESFSVVSISTISYYRRENSVTGLTVFKKRKADQYLDIFRVYSILLPKYNNTGLESEYFYDMMRRASLIMMDICDSKELVEKDKSSYCECIKEILGKTLMNNKIMIFSSAKSFVNYIYYKLPFGVKYRLRVVLRCLFG